MTIRYFLKVSLGSIVTLLMSTGAFSLPASEKAEVTALAISPNTETFLGYCALLPSNNIPLSLLATLMGSSTAVSQATSDLGPLISHSIFSSTISIDNNANTMLGVKSLPNRHEQLSNIAKAIDGYDAFIKKNSNKAYQIYYAKLWIEKNKGSLVGIANAYVNLADVCINLCYNDQALDYASRALNIFQNQLKNDPNSIAGAIHSYILIGRAYGDLEQSLNAFNAFLCVYKEYPEVQNIADPNNYQIYKHLGWHLRLLANIQDSFDGIAPDALNILMNHLTEIDTNHPHMVPGFNFFGEAGWSNDKHRNDFQTSLFNMSERCCQKALAIDLNNSGLINLNTAKSYGLLGWVYWNEKDYTNAAAYIKEEITIKTVLYSGYHADLAQANFVLGQIYEDAGSNNEALDNYTKAFKIYENVYPPTDPVMLKNMDQITEILHKMANTSG